MNSFFKNNSLLISKQYFPHNPNNLVLVFDTSKEPANNTVSVPINVGGTGTPNVNINWGDGTSSTVTSNGFVTKTYSSPGIYVVQISGTMSRLNYTSSINSANNKFKLVRCLSFGNIGLTSLSGAFYNCANLVECPSVLPSTVTNTTSCFQGCSIFNDYRVGLWDMANVTTISNMFVLNPLFNQNLNSWDTSNVTLMTSVFYQCYSFDQPLNNWNTSKVTHMNSMFLEARLFNQNINSWNTSNVIFMNHMFTLTRAFNQNLNNWNTSNVTRMEFMFWNASAFSKDISSWDIRKVNNMTTMFTGSTWGSSNYSAALIAWSQQISPSNNVIFGAGNNKYSSAAISARNTLINTYNWSITDGGVV